MIKNCSILIPIYKSTLEDFEDISLRQTIKVLGKYPIIFMAPHSLNTDKYLEYFKDTSLPKFEYFDDKYFLNTSSYSRLLLKKSFYLRFQKYKYFLICQLDAFVFRDELEFWCKKDYDYIGAPWVEVLNQPEDSFITGTGNGGFCLRKTSSMIRFFHNLKTIEILNDYLKFNFKGKIRYMFKYLIKPLYLDKFKDSYFINLHSTYEDQFICRYSNIFIDDFFKQKSIFVTIFKTLSYRKLKVGNLKDSLAFSLEWEPERQIGMNNNLLPFGCHAWQKNLHFWKTYIEEVGYKISFENRRRA